MFNKIKRLIKMKNWSKPYLIGILTGWLMLVMVSVIYFWITG